MIFPRTAARVALVLAASAAVAAVACRGGGSNPGAVTIPVIKPTVQASVCQNAGYPGDAPQFGDNASFAYTETASKLRYFDHVAGTGATPATDSVVQVRYTGWLNANCIFDTTYVEGGGEPAQFSLTGVIPGWREGIGTMKVSGKRRLEIPSGLAYGPVGFPPVIPPDATLTFEVELLGVLTLPEAEATASVIRTATATVRDATATARAATATAKATPGLATATPQPTKAP